MGGMGVVYEVDDTARQEIVALKTLRRTTAVDIYRLKREFRSLADVGASQPGQPLRAVCRRRSVLLHDGARAWPELRRLRPRHGRSGPFRRARGLGGSATGGGLWPSIASASCTAISSRPMCWSPLTAGSSSSTSASSPSSRLETPTMTPPAASARPPTCRRKRHRMRARRRPPIGTPSASRCSKR